MAKLLRIRDRILIGLSLVNDVFDDLRLAGGIVTKEYEIVYGFAPDKYKKQNLYSVVNKMLTAGQIEKTLVNGTPVFRITSVGKGRIVRSFPLLSLQNKKWDKKWRVVTFDIPEEIRWKRDRLRRKLVELGFGMVQESVWATPHAFEDDIKNFITESSLSDYVYVFVAGEYFIGDIDSLAEKIWNIEDLNERYKDFVETVNKENREESKRSLLNNYFTVVMSDPFLPKELLPKSWWGDKAREIAKKLSFA